MARRKSDETRPAVPTDDSLDLQSRGVGNEGGNFGSATASGPAADAEKTPLANDASIDAMAAAIGHNKNSRRASPSPNEEASPEARTMGRTMGRTTRKSSAAKASPKGSRMAPKSLADKMQTGVASNSRDRASRKNPDAPRATGARGARPNPKNETSGSRRKPNQRTGHLKLDQGAG
jgi:hypothetical protein